MAISCVPTYPLILMGVIEPLMLIWGYITALRSPSQFYFDQAPAHTYSTVPEFTPQAHVYSLMLANVYLLLAALGVICLWTPHADIAKKFLFVVALADYGHIYAAYAGLGPEVFWDWRGWNDMVWGNVGVSVFLNVHRLLALMGAFGAFGTGNGGKGKGKKA